MESAKDNRTVSLYCPICASLEFKSDLETVTCTSCDTEFSREELIAENSENIEAHKREIIEQVVSDFKTQLKDVFIGNKPKG